MLISFQTYPGTNFHIAGGGHWGHCNSNCPLHEDTVEIRTTAEVEKCTTVNGENGICKPAATCVVLTDEEEAAETCALKSHVCCKELLENNPTIKNKLKEIGNQVGPTFEKPQEISIEDVNEIFSRFGPTFEAVEAEEDEGPRPGFGPLGASQDSEESSEEDDDDESPVNLHLAFNR